MADILQTIELPHIKYVGSGYSGHWEIIDKEEK